MHENGILLAESQSELTVLQRFVYILAADYYTEQAKNNSKPSGLEKGRDITNSW